MEWASDVREIGRYLSHIQITTELGENKIKIDENLKKTIDQ